MKYGITLWMKDKQYEVISEKDTKKYSIGGLISDYLRLPLDKLKDIIEKIPFGEQQINTYNMELIKKYIFREIKKLCQFVCRDILISEYLFYSEQYDKLGMDWIEDLIEHNNRYRNKIIELRIVPEECMITHTELNTVKDYCIFYYVHVMRDYCLVAMMLEAAEHTFTLFGSYNIDEKSKDTKLNPILIFFEKYMSEQDIDYKIMLIEGVFTPTYIIRTAVSLMVFDFAQMCENNIGLCRCRNCGKLFALSGRTDMKYCSYPLKDGSGKTCKDVGAQNVWAEKEKNDEGISSYRRVYKKLTMSAVRHPDDESALQRLFQFKTKGKEMRNKYAKGELTTEELLIWLRAYD